MLRHWSILVIVGILGPNTTLSVLAPLNLTINPEHVHISPSNDVNILCKADQPLVACQFKVRHISVYELSAGFFTPFSSEFSYFGEGLENGDCGVTLRGQALEFVVYMVGCRARTSTSDWAFRETALINKRRDGMNVSISPGRTLIVQPGEPIKILVDAHIPLSRCTFVLTNDYSKTNNRRRFNFDGKNVPFTENARGTDIEYYGTGVDKGQCGFQVPSAREELNDGAWVDVYDSENHEETVFFRIIVTRAPIAPILTHNSTYNPISGNLDLNAWCTVRSRPAANLTWYLGDKPVEDKLSQSVPVDEWLWPSNVQTVTQKLTLSLGSKFNGQHLWCTVDHFALKEPLESERIQIEIISPPSSPILELKTPYLSEGFPLEATCKVNNWQPGARITWFLGDAIVRLDNTNDDPLALPGANTITQHLKYLLHGRDNGQTLKCEVAHDTLAQPLQATRVVQFTYCSPLLSKTVRISCSIAGEQVDCSLPQQVGTVAQLVCKPGHTVASSIVYRRVTCLRAVKWDRPVFTCTPDETAEVDKGTHLSENSVFDEPIAQEEAATSTSGETITSGKYMVAHLAQNEKLIALQQQQLDATNRLNTVLESLLQELLKKN